jgi:hypothetical protein
MQLGVCVFYFVLGGAGTSAVSPAGAGASSLWLIALGPLLVSMLVRVLLIVLTPAAHLAFALFIFGISLAESVCFIGLFLAPEHKLELFILSALGILQFLPWYAGKFYNS